MKIKRIISTIVLVPTLLSLLAGCSMNPQQRYSGGNNVTPNMGMTQQPQLSTEATQISYEQDILDSVEQSKNYVIHGNFVEALALLDTAQQLYGADYRIDEQRKAVQIAKVLHEAEQYETNNDYVNAIIVIENAVEEVKAEAVVVQKLNSLKISYKNYVLIEAENAFISDGYAVAIAVLNEALKMLPNNEEINATIKRYEEYIPVNIATLEYFTGNDFVLENNIKDNLGNIHNNVVSAKSIGLGNAETKNVYKINKQYSRLTGIWFQRYDFRTEIKYGIAATNYWSKIEIYGDDKLLYAGEMQVGCEPQRIDVDISGVTELKIYYFGGGSDGSYSGVADFNVQK